MPDYRERVPVAEVRQAVMNLMPQYGRVESHTLVNAAEDQLGTGYAHPDTRAMPAVPYDREYHVQQRTYAESRERLAGQVTRSLNDLARQGTLRKAGSGERMPGGLRKVPHRGAYWYTHEAWEAAEVAALEQRKEQDREARRAARVSERAGALGILLTVPPERLLHALEQLLDLAEKGARHG